MATRQIVLGDGTQIEVASRFARAAQSLVDHGRVPLATMSLREMRKGKGVGRKTAPAIVYALRHSRTAVR